MRTHKLMLILATAAATVASATDYTVTSSADDGGAGTLRTLIGAAVDGDRFLFGSGVDKITLAGTEILVNDTIEIVGDGVVIDGNGASRILTVNSSADSLVLSGLVLTNGLASVTGGGAIYVQSATKVTLTNCVVTDCHTTNTLNGAGIHNNAHFLAVDCRFVGNTIGGTNASGGAIYNNTSSKTGLVSRCHFSGNSAPGTGGGGGGGGIFHGAGMLTVADSLFSNNTTTAGWGGGFGTTGASANSLVRDSLFVGNFARQGGGLGARTAWTVDGCTFLRNVSISGGGATAQYSGAAWNVLDCLFEENVTTNSAAPAYGGAIYNREGIGTISNCVFRANSDRNGAGTSGTGGAIATYTSGSLTTYASLFDGNRSLGAGGAVYLNHPGTFIDCTFVTNACVTDGGAYYGTGTNAKQIQNCTFSGNVAGDGTGDNGGGIYLGA